ncbi:MAG: GNAT family N-acetyltransferase [Tannerellaceae bacterium]|jgi:diamine N-acetyltransferase|nr:GNAT family N-acetyltransferase [Tannerellaceae bacterium]
MKLLKNDRLRLRTLEPEDIDLLYAWENDTSLWAWGSTVSPYSRYTLKEYIAGSHQNIYEARQLRLMIEDTASGTGVGLIDLYDFDPHHRKAATGILIDPSRQRQGVATDSLNLLAAYAFSFLKLHQLYAYIPADNGASRALFLRCGFCVSGVLKDWISSGDGGFSDVLFAQRINKGNGSGSVSE